MRQSNTTHNSSKVKHLKHMKRQHLCAAIAVVVLTACARERAITEVDGPALLVAGAVTAERVPGGMRVANGTSRAIPYVVVDQGFLGLLADCGAADSPCQRLAAGATVTIREGIDGFGGFGDAAVYWWGPDGDATKLHTILVGGGKPYRAPPPPSDTTSD
jgi:hypothetical protein